ncbi:Mch4p [Sugiyamaella lignohabitans]|uniref:Mch4p n=1 Tax=Sugiyamaella lignohabitans TaxID=796027 RepID=A0A167D661_9ASCO|nr:Mch4p [Sugiyamaella lignohabitans]ANB12530.1 Mch4p [Sugiyamaella lignohabitans]
MADIENSRQELTAERSLEAIASGPFEKTADVTCAQTGSNCEVKESENEKLSRRGSRNSHSGDHNSTVNPNLPEEDMDFPEGGVRAWLVVFGSWAAMTSTFGIVNTSGYLQAWLSEHQLQHMSQSQISWIFSIYLFLFFLGGVLVGPIFDNYGLRPIFIPGCIGSVASLFILSVCKEYYQFILGFSILGGASATLVFTPSIAIVGHWFYRRRAGATGIACTGGACGGIMFPLLMIKLMPKIGFGWTIRIVGFIALFLLVVAVATLETRVPLAKSSGTIIDIKSLKDPRFACTTIGIFMIEWAIFIPITYLTSYALAKGVNQTFSYQLLAILNAGSILGRGLPGYLADIFGRFNVMIITTVVCAVMCLALWLPAGSSVTVMIAFAVMFGFWSGTGICLTPVCVSQVCKTEDYGKRYGTCYFFASFAVLTGLPIAGAIQNAQNGSYQGLILFASLTYLCGTCFFVLARIIGGGWKLTAIY